MQRDEILPAAAMEKVRQLGGADIVVGIPSYNNVRTIGHVLRAVQAGLAKYFPRSRCLIVNSDGGSTDGTQDVVHRLQADEPALLLIAHPLFTIHRLSTPYHGLPGKGSALRCIFRIAELLKARGCAVVDSDLRSIAPEWMHLLLGPVLEQGYDYVAPYYARHKYDGTITNSIVYPMTRALYGQQVRQPIGGDFGFSGRVAAHYLTKPVWATDVARYGIDIWMTTTAICEGFRVCQAFLGAKIHDAKDPGADLSAMLAQVVSSLFSLMETYEQVWTRLQGSAPSPVFGFRFAVGVDPIGVDLEHMVNQFRRGVADLRGIWRTFLRTCDLELLDGLAMASTNSFRVDDDLWVRLMYDFAVAYHQRALDRHHLVRSLLPLYMGRVASFVAEVANSSALEVEEKIERLSRAFEAHKSYLADRWSGKPPKVKVSPECPELLKETAISRA